MTKKSPPVARARAKHDAPPKRKTVQPADIERVCEHLEHAVPLATAARLEGWSPDAIEDRMAREPETRALIERARAVGQMELLGEMRSLIAGGGATAGTQWLLERLYPKQFGKSAVEVQLTGANGGAVKTEVKLSIEQAIAGAKGEKP